MHEYEAPKDLFEFLNLILVLWYLNDFLKQNLHFFKLVKFGCFEGNANSTFQAL